MIDLQETLSKINHDSALLLTGALMANEQKYFTIYRNEFNNLYLLTYFSDSTPYVIDLNTFQLLNPVQVLYRFSYSNVLSKLNHRKANQEFTFIRRTPSIDAGKILPLYFNLIASTSIHDTKFNEWANHLPQVKNQLFIGQSDEEFYLLSHITIGRLSPIKVPNILIENPYIITVTNPSMPFLFKSIIDKETKLHLHFSISTFNKNKHYLQEINAAIIQGHAAVIGIIENHTDVIIYYHPLATLHITEFLIELLIDQSLINQYHLSDNTSQLILHLILVDYNSGAHADLENSLVNCVYEYQSKQWKEINHLTPIEKENLKEDTIGSLIRVKSATKKGLTIAIPKTPEFYIPVINRLLTITKRSVALRPI